jgi:hypothetical protein
MLERFFCTQFAGVKNELYENDGNAFAAVITNRL